MIENMQRATARVVDINWHYPIAFSPYVTLELVENPSILPVPSGKTFFTGLLYWQDYWIPVLDIRSLICGEKQTTTARYCLIMTYHNLDTDSISFAGIVTNEIAQNIGVSNSDLCALPSDNDIWQGIASSSVLIDGKAVPIVDATALFNYHSD